MVALGGAVAGVVCGGLGGFQWTNLCDSGHGVLCVPAMATENVGFDGVASGTSQEDPLASLAIPGWSIIDTSWAWA